MAVSLGGIRAPGGRCSAGCDRGRPPRGHRARRGAGGGRRSPEGGDRTRLTEVAVAAPGRFHDSAGLDLCGLQWSLTPEAAAAGIAGFDIDLAGERRGARVTRTPAGASGYSRVTVAFERDFGTAGKAVDYTATLRFLAAPPPGQVQAFHHTLK